MPPGRFSAVHLAGLQLMVMTPQGELCEATLRHRHGESLCRIVGPHEQHRGTCWGCFEDGEDSILYWREYREVWP